MEHMTKIIELEPLWSLIQNDSALLSSMEIKLWKQQKIPKGQIWWLFIAGTKMKEENEVALWLMAVPNPPFIWNSLINETQSWS